MIYDVQVQCHVYVFFKRNQLLAAFLFFDQMQERY